MSNSTLPSMSAKTIREIREGKRNTNGTVKVSAADLQAKKDRQTLRIREAIFGKGTSFAKESKAAAKAKAILHFSRFIRLRDAAANGRVKCVTCQHYGPWTEFDAGHFISCGKEATRFDERNVHAQCGNCNRYQGGHFLEHEQFIERKYGEGTAKSLKEKAGMLCKRTLFDYQCIAADYAKRVAWIKEHEPSKFTRAA